MAVALFGALLPLAAHPQPDATQPAAAGDAQSPAATAPLPQRIPAPLPMSTESAGAQPSPGLERARDLAGVGGQIEAALRSGWSHLRAHPLATLDHWLAVAGLPDSRTAFPLALAALLGSLLLIRIVRGRGDLVVAIEYPHELRGTFSVRASQNQLPMRRGPRITSPEAADLARRRARSSNRTERHLVSRETSFQNLPSGRWHVTVDGFLQEQEQSAVIGTHFAERDIEVQRGRTVRLDVELQPRQCPVEVKVLWGREPAHDARVGWRGQPTSLRYSRGGSVRLLAELGAHNLVVGGGDRIAEIPLEITSFQARNLTVDLSDRDRLLFAGCPRAVEPYLHGDFKAAAEALEAEGDSSAANLILARVCLERDQRGAAARHLIKAGRLLEAAALHRTLGNHAKAAELYESCSELEQAAELWRLAGQPERAGELYERGRDFDSAAVCFKEAGAISRWTEMLEKSGAGFEAARVALDHGDTKRAIHSLRNLGPDSEVYPQASELLVGVLLDEGQVELAAERASEVAREHPESPLPLALCERLASALESGAYRARALEVLEQLQTREPQRTDLSPRIEALRESLAREQSSAAPSAPVRDVFGAGFRYEILEEIGRGGMGIVYKARDVRLGREVALKRMPDNLRNHPKAVELFLREARACAALNHPNIVTVHDVGQQGDSFFMTMELLQGRPLQQILERAGSLTTKDVARIGIQVCKGLAYAHASRVVHRDIKTANLFVTQSQLVKIMDFGLAKMMEEVRRASTVIGGTPYYMAPEQSLGGGALDPRADLYALGVTFFELLTGTLPFPEGDVAYHHRHTPAPDPRARGAQIPPPMAELVLTLLAKRPEQRPESAEAVRQRLKQVLYSLS